MTLTDAMRDFKLRVDKKLAARDEAFVPPVKPVAEVSVSVIEPRAVEQAPPDKEIIVATPNSNAAPVQRSA